MPNKATPAIVVKDKGKKVSYCGKNAEKNKAEKEGKSIPIEKEGGK